MNCEHILTIATDQSVAECGERAKERMAPNLLTSFDLCSKADEGQGQVQGQSGFELFQAVRTMLISFQNLRLMLQLVSSLGTLINPVAFCTSREKRAGLSTCFS